MSASLCGGEAVRVVATGDLGVVVGVYRRAFETVLVALNERGSVCEFPADEIERAGVLINAA